MQISVTFRQIEPSEALKNYVTERLNKFKRYLDGPVEAHVVLGQEKFRHLADVTIDSNGRIIKGREENADMYAAIDLVMDKIDMQLKKLREKMRDKGDRIRAAAPLKAVEESPGLPPIRRKRVEVPALELADAVEMMQSGNDNLLVFTNVANGALGILYRRQDGQFVLVEPDLS
ncbi:MAG: ribosome-associated translation inhibitor RaiA [Deltaproteobacteria bacterium]|nr:ribosome-associated translation inhibitor RaiA [Deltaproteobacteria bacterium]MBI4795489.1 ribosome-associated translation inhibitor RaiA [Deltaproteobacteria bacterium]